ncbi:MAG: hydroxymethylbilane synthase [Clostridia bacterium]
MIKIGSRKSPLAMRQTELVAEKLKNAFPDEEFEIVGISTKGDRQLDKSLQSFGGKGVFIKELEAAILSGEVQMAVHSAKDMPTELPDGLSIGAVIERGSHEDVLVCCGDTKIDFSDRMAKIIIGTGSIRREYQLRELFPNAQAKPIRGNIHTRLEKMRKGEYDAIVLARAALERLGITGLKILPLDFVCAAGQGIIAVEVKAGAMQKYMQAINDEETYRSLIAEREFLSLSGGGCHAPVGAFARAENDEIIMETFQVKNGKIIRRKMSDANPLVLARKMAEQSEGH